MTNQLDWLFQPFAHRGLHDASQNIIENTETAFQRAIDAGYGIELDVQVTGDGEIAVFHDATLDRLTTSTGAVASMSMAQLKQVKFKASSDRIQTLNEFLEQVAGRVPLLIEVKTDWKGHGGPRERRVAECIANYKGEAAVMSFDPYAMQAIGGIDASIVRGLVSERFLGAHERATHSYSERIFLRHLFSAFIARPHFVSYDVQALPALAPWVWRSLLRRPLLCWTVRSHQQAQSAKKWADAITFEGFTPEQTGA